MELTPYNVISLSGQTGCAGANAYLAPGTFVLSFAVGVIFGLGSGLKSRLDLIWIDLNEKSVEKIKTASPTLNEKIKPIQDKFSEYSEKMPSIVRPLFNGFLYISGYKSIYDTASSLTGGFEEQRKSTLQKLSPLPGTILNMISATSLAANLGYLTYPVLSHISILSGYPAGYSAGLFLASLNMKQT